MIIFPDLPHVEVEGVEVAEEITLILRTKSPTASCPFCATASSRIQSRYTRMLRDLPSVGHPIRLILHVRRFFCKKSTCAQKIFVERLPELCHPHAQRTKRLQKALCELGLKGGGQAGADMGTELGYSGSRDTILRLVQQAERPALPEPHVIGLDDWAWKRRSRYGTLICDLEWGVPIDLLPDRAVETVSAWLKAHPSVDTISRDGSAEYASAIKKGAPQAREVSDRWHLVKNLAGCVAMLLAESLAQFRRAEVAAAANSKLVESPSGEPPNHLRTRAERRAQQARQGERNIRYEQITALHKQGMKSAEIAAIVGIAERTVRQWLSRGDVPYAGPRKARSSPLDPYKPYLVERWQQGCPHGSTIGKRTASQRLQRVTKGALSLFGHLRALCQFSFQALFCISQQKMGSRPHPLLTLSAPQATWLFFRKAGDLKAEEQESLRQLRQASPHLESAYQLVEAFLHMVRERRAEQFDTWLAALQASGLEAFTSFVTGVLQDKDAVLAGLSLPWSNGPLEGNVNRLKLIKRSMYGRAEIDLLKLRVLHHSKKSQERKKKGKKQGQQQVPLKKPAVMKKGINSQSTTSGISKVA